MQKPVLSSFDPSLQILGQSWLRAGRLWKDPGQLYGFRPQSRFVGVHIHHGAPLMVTKHCPVPEKKALVPCPGNWTLAFHSVPSPDPEDLPILPSLRM